LLLLLLLLLLPSSCEKKKIYVFKTKKTVMLLTDRTLAPTSAEKVLNLSITPAWILSSMSGINNNILWFYHFCFVGRIGRQRHQNALPKMTFTQTYTYTLKRRQRANPNLEH
jgi:hypothetical protein